MTDPVVGREYCGYRIERKLAEGGMGVVYLGVHDKIGRRGAVKVLKLEYCRDEAVVQRFYQEARAVNEIGHPGIVDIYDFGRDADGRVFFVMELLEGEPLSRRLSRGPQSWAEAKTIIDQIGDALAAAHDKGFVHRDLKPDNIWLRYDPMTGKVAAKLLDFGIAKLVGLDGAKDKLTKTGAIIGTPHYMSPEQINGADVDARTDIYALGVIIYEMLSGATPFGGDTLGAILMGHLITEAPRLPPLPPAAGVPPWIPDVVASMLAKDREQRPPTVKAVLAALSGQGARTEVGRRTAPRPRWPWVVIAGVLAAGGVGAALALRRSSPAVVVAPRPPDAPPQAVPPPKTLDVEKLRADAQALLRGTVRAAEPATRVLGSDALGELRDQPSAPALAGLVETDPDAEVRGHAAGALGQIGLDPTARALLGRLETAAPAPLKVWFAEALARAHDPEARKRLASYAADTDLAVSFKAALAYADLAPAGDPTAIDLLTKLAAREAELNAVAPFAGAVLLTKLGRLRVTKAHAILAAALEGTDERARLAAAEGLGRLGDDRGHQVALAILNDKASPNRLVAATILVGLGDYSGYPLLVEKLGDADAAVRRQAARGLGLVGERDGLPALAAKLDDPAAAVKIAAAAAVLATIGLDPKLLAQASVDWTQSALASEDWAVRRGAAALVGDLPERQAVPLLAQALADPAPGVRQEVARAARKLKGPAATRALVAVVKKETDAPAREEMVKALAARKDPEARAALTAIAGERGRAAVLAAGGLAALGDASAAPRIDAAVKDKSEDVRRAGVEAAAGAKLLPALATAIGDSLFSVRFLAAESLAGLGEKSDAEIAILRAATASTELDVRTRAAAALLRLGEPLTGLTLPPVVELLADDDPRTRIAALAIVAAMPPAEAEPLLRRALFDPDVDVRRAAVGTLDGFVESDRDGVTRLLKAVLRDPDAYVRAKAGALLATLVAPILPPDAPIPTDLAALQQASEALEQARKDAGALRDAVSARADELAGAVGQPARDDAALRNVERLVAAIQQALEGGADIRKRIDFSAALAERAGGSAPTGDAAKLLDADGKLAAEGRELLDSAGELADAAVRRGRRYMQNETGDAATYAAAADAELAAGKLADARKDLDRAAKLMRAAGQDPTPLKWSYGVLSDKLAGREKAPAARLALLKQAKASFDEFAAKGSGPRVAAARTRSGELADEIRELEGEK